MQQYAVGQEVGFVSYGSWGMGSHGFGKIVKINGHGHIKLDNGRVFDKHGNERAKFSRMRLTDPAQLRESIVRQNAARDRRVAAQDIERYLNSHKTGYGDIRLSDEQKAELIALVNKL